MGLCFLQDVKSHWVLVWKMHFSFLGLMDVAIPEILSFSCSECFLEGTFTSYIRDNNRVLNWACMFTDNFLLLEFEVNSHVEIVTASCFLYLIQIKSLNCS